MIDQPYPPPAVPPAEFLKLYTSFVDPEKEPEEAVEVLSKPEIAAHLADEMARSQEDWPNLSRYAAANAEIIASGRPVEAVFIGDSITEIWPYAHDDLFSETVVNRGIGGQTTPQILLRFYADAVALRPRIVHILAGINDVAGRSGPNRPEDFRNNIRAMVDIAQANGIAVLLGSLLPTSSYFMMPDITPAPRVIELNAWLRALCEERDGAWYVDYFSAMRNAENGMARAISNDGLHPNRNGYDLMRPLAEEALATARRALSV